MFVGTKNTEKKLANEIQHYLGPMELCEYGCGAKHFKMNQQNKIAANKAKAFLKIFILHILIY